MESRHLLSQDTVHRDDSSALLIISAAPPRRERSCVPCPNSSALYEGVLTFSVIAVGAYAGAFIRVGFSFYHGSGTFPSGFTVMYAELLGSFIMGIASVFQARLLAGRRIDRLLYVFVATGLCGSITTFSTWHFETSKLFLGQLDDSPGALRDTYTGGKLLTWIVTLWLGFGLPFTALVAGQHLAQAVEGAGSAPASDGSAKAATPTSLPAPPAPPRHEARAAEAAVLVAFVCSTLVAVGVPLWCGWDALAWTAGLGAVGAYARFLLSPLNKGLPALSGGGGGDGCCARGGRALGLGDGRFPVGTFLANAIGSTVQAAASSAARFAVSYHDLPAQAVLYGVSVGFCGCLTTLSSFVLELQRLPRRAAYVYGAASYACAILAATALFIAPAAVFATAAARAPLSSGPYVDWCMAYPAVCTRLLDHVSCPPATRSIGGCAAGGGVADFRASCRCGGFDATARVSELLIDAQCKQRVAGALVPAWAGLVDAGGVRGDDAAEGVDACLSHSNLCGNLMNRLQCPQPLRRIDSCGRRGLRRYAGVCACGGVDAGSTRVSALIADHLLARRYDLLPYGGYPGSADPPLDLCTAAVAACTDLLDHVLCPPGARRLPACAQVGAVAGMDPTCECFGPSPAASGGYAIGYAVGTDRVVAGLVDASARAWAWPLVVRTRPGGAPGAPPALFDACASFTALCALWHATVGCPPADRRVAACSANGTADAWLGECACGPYAAGGERARTWLIDAVLAADLYDYTFVGQPLPPFELIVLSNPAKQLLTPAGPLPGDE